MSIKPIAFSPEDQEWKAPDYEPDPTLVNCGENIDPNGQPGHMTEIPCGSPVQPDEIQSEQPGINEKTFLRLMTDQDEKY